MLRPPSQDSSTVAPSHPYTVRRPRVAAAEAAVTAANNTMTCVLMVTVLLCCLKSLFSIHCQDPHCVSAEMFTVSVSGVYCLLPTDPRLLTRRGPAHARCRGRAGRGAML